MKKEIKRKFSIALCMLGAFVLWTILVCIVDVREIGPNNSAVGFATLNGFVHRLTGVHMWLYVITDWLGLVPVAFVLGFGIQGIVQWIKRGHILKVDYSLLVLGGFYIVVMAVYILFETVVINYRPVLINGYLEASYPSSTTMLCLCVMPTVIMQFNSRTKHSAFKNCVAVTLMAFSVFMVVGRLVSGVHWISDIVGGVLLSAGLVMSYRAAICLQENLENRAVL